MIEVQWSEIRNPNLHEALRVIMRQPTSYQTALKFLTLKKELEGELEKSEEMLKTLFDKYSTDKRQFVPKEDIKDEATKQLDEFGKTKFSSKMSKIKRGDLMGIQISALGLEALGPFLED